MKHKGKERITYKEEYPLIEDVLNKIVKRIINTVHPKKIILFGSAARGEMGPNSDFDLLVIVPSGMHRRKTVQKFTAILLGSVSHLTL